MIDWPQTKKEAQQTRYGAWAGVPNGASYVPTRCAADVWSDMLGHQCLRRPGHGPEGLFCKMHAKRNVERNRRAAEHDQHQKTTETACEEQREQQT